MAEAYTALVLAFWFSGFTVFAAMRPRTRVRFSKHFLLSSRGGSHAAAAAAAASASSPTEPSPGLHPTRAKSAPPQPSPPPGLHDISAPESEAWAPEELSLCLRLVRESPHALRDARVSVQAVVGDTTSYGSTTWVAKDLPLVSSTLSSLDYWELRHVITPASPLYEIRNELRAHLTSLEVSLCVFDTSYMQEVRLYTSYHVGEFVMRAHYDQMANSSPHPRTGAPVRGRAAHTVPTAPQRTPCIPCPPRRSRRRV